MEDRAAVQRYRVGSSASSNVSVYHLKLTDASSKALEEFQKSKVCFSVARGSSLAAPGVTAVGQDFQFCIVFLLKYDKFSLISTAVVVFLASVAPAW